MTFDYYLPFSKTGKDGKRAWIPGVRTKVATMSELLLVMQSDNVKAAVGQVRAGNAEMKKALPAVTWCGHSSSGYRRAADMTPTGFFMVDIDHCEKPLEAWEKIQERLGNEWLWNVLIVHITPSGKGLRIVQACTERGTLEEHMERLRRQAKLDDFGDFDAAVHDISRLSFLPDRDSVLFVNISLADGGSVTPGLVVTTQEVSAKESAVHERPETEITATEAAAGDYSGYTYRGHLLTDIIKRYVEIFGEPGQGERHNFYNQMVKYFRCICDNNPLVLCQLLPRFDTEASENDYLSQCRSICRTNTTGRLPKEFFMFLLKNGFYKEQEAPLAEIVEKESENYVQSMPKLPPVFSEIVGSCPKDFAIPCINALLPIMGTLTSYVRAVYPLDAREHSTEFFSIVYAPPGTGKGFIERFISLLLRNLELRDILSDRREALYCEMQTRKGDNERAPENPRVTKRIMESKNSETDFLEKQAANNGHHMFTYAAEMDQWRKGVRAAGGNKDDMIRIAWDNGYYGQSFKSPNSFKGRVRLYWNVLITGTQDQLDAYFKNVTNGLVTRCGFSSIDNQEYADAPKWKKISKKGLDVITKFVDRCDKNEYKQPLDFDFSMLDEIANEDFDKEVPWRFAFNDIQIIDLEWIMPTINRWLKHEQKRALLAQDQARDVFRRRVAVRGFRLALICSQLWETMTEKNKKTVCDFVAWWMSVDLAEIIKLYGDKYNEMVAGAVTKSQIQPNVWDILPDSFSVGDVEHAKNKAGVYSPVRLIISRWKKAGLIEKTGKTEYKKTIKK